MMVAYQGYRIAIKAPDTFSGLLAAGITTWLIAQACINMMVVTALLPVTGIPLPFISYGGSALTINLVAVGILLSISRETTQTGSLLDAVFGVGRRNRRAHLPRAGRRKGTARRAARRLRSATSAAPAASSAGSWPGMAARRLPYHQLMVRSLRSCRAPTCTSSSIRCAWRLGAAGGGAPAAAASGRHLHDRRVPGLPAGAPRRGRAAIPPGLGGERRPGPCDGERSARAGDPRGGLLPADPRRVRAARFVSGTPIRSFAGVDRLPPAPRSGWGGRRLLLASAGSQAVARFSAAIAGALPQLLADWHVLHITGPDGLPAAIEARQALPARSATVTCRRRSSPIAWPMRSWLPTSCSAALGPRRARRWRRWASHPSSSRTRTPARISAPTPPSSPTRARRSSSTMPTSPPTASPRSCADLRDDARRASMAAAARALGQPDAAARLAAELLRMAGEAA